jgi:hypothetical protein
MITEREMSELRECRLALWLTMSQRSIEWGFETA